MNKFISVFITCILGSCTPSPAFALAAGNAVINIPAILIFLAAVCIGYMAATYLIADCILCKYFKSKKEKDNAK